MKKITSVFLIAVFALTAPSAVFAIDDEQFETPPVVSQTTSGGSVGGSFIYCSGPMAPGWNVNLPNGGCSQGSNGNGNVLGATTSCAPYLAGYLHKDWNNNQDEVKKLQTFLNKEMGLALVVSGLFDSATFDAVVKFQEKYSDEILKPWGITTGTGFVYIRTVQKINSLQCGS